MEKEQPALQAKYIEQQTKYYQQERKYCIIYMHQRDRPRVVVPESGNESE